MRTKFRKSRVKILHFQLQMRINENSIWKLGTKALYQVENAMLALEAMRYLVKEEKHLNRWKEALYKTHWEGRMEEILPGVILDGAHNPGAVEVFVESVNAQQENNFEKIILVLSGKEKNMNDDTNSFVETIDAKEYILTQIEK